MGKLKELFKEYMSVAVNSPREKEIVDDVNRISEWMMKEGFSTKPVELPSKTRFKSKTFIELYKDVSNLPRGLYCGVCTGNVTLEMIRCPQCDHGLGGVICNG